MKTPRRRTLTRQVTALRSQLARARMRLPADDMTVRTLRVLVNAYALQYGSLEVSAEAASHHHMADACPALYVPERNRYVMPGGTPRPSPTADLGVLLIMAARHAMKTRTDADAFALAEACTSLGRGVEPGRASVTAQELAQSLVFERRPFAPMSYGEQMQRALAALKPCLSPRDRALVEDIERRHIDVLRPVQ